MGRKKALPVVVAIQFVADFDHVAGNRTVAYKAGMVVRGPSDELAIAAGARAVPYADETQLPDFQALANGVATRLEFSVSGLSEEAIRRALDDAPTVSGTDGE